MVVAVNTHLSNGSEAMAGRREARLAELTRIREEAIVRINAVPLRTLIRETYEANDGSIMSPGFQVVALHYVRQRISTGRGPYRVILRKATGTLRAVLRNLYSIDIPRTTVLGRRFRVAHGGVVVLHPNAVFGDDCRLRHNVTVAVGNEYAKDITVIGDRVAFGVGAIVFGGVRVGDDVRIGPNAVVTTDVPSGAFVFAPPARTVVRASPRRAEDADRSVEAQPA